MRLKKIKMVLFFLFLCSCGPTQEDIDFQNSKITGVVDSVVVTGKITQYKKHYFLINNKWFMVRAGWYTQFIKYLDKGDSLSKASGRWDIYVYKKKNEKWVEKYFRGAQDDWD